MDRINSNRHQIQTPIEQRLFHVSLIAGMFSDSLLSTDECVGGQAYQAYI